MDPKKIAFVEARAQVLDLMDEEFDGVIYQEWVTQDRLNNRLDAILNDLEEKILGKG